MKFIVDAQLPRSLAGVFVAKGYDAIHTDDLPDKERTTDNQIRTISIEQSRIVVTKDSDFVDSYLIKGIPRKLLLIATGNIKNAELLALISNNFSLIISLLQDYNLVEVCNNKIIGHE